MMRKSIKNSLNIILAASLLMSCSASNDAPDSLADGSHAVKLNMRVGVSAGVVTGSRELDTWDGAQQVNDMRIYVFRCPEDKKGTPEEAYTYCTPIETEAAKKGYYSVDAFNNREPYYSAEHQNMPEQHLYTFEPYLQNGYYYQFLAIGRDDKYATTKVLTEPKFTINETKLEDARIALTEEAKNSVKLGILNTTELFNGILQDEKTHEEAPVLVTEETKYFYRTLTASRNVAGLMIYVENIPAQVESNAAGDVSTVTFTPTSLSVVATGITTETLIRQKQAPADADSLTYQTLGTIDLTPHEGIFDFQNIRHFCLNAARAVESDFIEEPVAFCSQHGADVVGTRYLEQLQRYSRTILSFPYRLHTLQFAVAIESDGECLDYIEAQHAATRTSHDGKACHRSLGIVIIHIFYTYYRVYGYPCSYHGVHLCIVVE
jgi:hypothetical protein